MDLATKTGTVKVVQPSGCGVKPSVPLCGDNTVATVCSKAGISTAECQIRVNNNPAQPNQVLNPGDTILLLPQPTGNWSN